MGKVQLLGHKSHHFSVIAISRKANKFFFRLHLQSPGASRKSYCNYENAIYDIKNRETTSKLFTMKPFP